MQTSTSEDMQIDLIYIETDSVNFILIIIKFSSVFMTMLYMHMLYMHIMLCRISIPIIMLCSIYGVQGVKFQKRLFHLKLAFPVSDVESTKLV